MPIVQVLLLVAACSPMPWWPPPFELGGTGSLSLTALAMMVPVCFAFVLNRWAATTIRVNPSSRPEVANLYSRLRWLNGYLMIICGVLSVVSLGWGWTVWHRFNVTMNHRTFLAPMAELLVPAPYLLSIFTTWLFHYDAEKAIHDASLHGVVSFWSRRGHFAYHFRPYALLVLMPILFLSVYSSFARLQPELAEEWWVKAAELLMVPGFFLFMPLLVKPALGFTTMPAGPHRERLEQLSKKLNFRCTDLLLWHTRGLMANAMVVGAVPWVRYVVITDKLLESLDSEELDAVFGHEVGHVKHLHMPYYAIFLALSLMVTAGFAAVIVNMLESHNEFDYDTIKDWMQFSPLLLIGGYLFLVFGYLSRKCERQADLYGAKVAGFPAMIRALERVAIINGMDYPHPVHTRWFNYRRWMASLRAWQHGTIGERIQYLSWASEHPGRETRFQWWVFILRTILLLALIASTIVLGCKIGWAEILRSL